MKKITLALSLLAVLFTACHKPEEETADPTVSKLEVVLNMNKISADILDYFDVTYSYIDFEGKTVSQPITGPAQIAFSVANPTLGEEASTPFTVELSFKSKYTIAKEEGTYDSTLDYTLDVNGYDQKGQLITDSGKVQSSSSNIVFNADKFKAFQSTVRQCDISTIEYKTFFCKTLSGEWHIGVEGTPVDNVIIVSTK